MSYVVLARKWRPMSFEDLVGQDHVSRTLGNAIQAGRVAHAFLFTGVRGVGKTTAARILAKAMNCMGTAEAPQNGPTATPCLTCAACREITAGTDIDVREIDGASYNGVDEVRKLQDSLPYRPARDRFKIFIVDEVHMLSQSAWNAFLKTLEEPPPHIKFIFATTEVHKVPVTILSRVQRFDFKLIPAQLIAKRLKHVLSVEGIPSDDGALAILSREAAGSMRDAMSLLDQVIAWNDQKLDADSVARVLGVASRQVLHDVAKALVDGDAARCLEIVASLSNQGYDVATVARDVLGLLRDLVVVKVCKEPADLLDLADLERNDVQALSERSSVDDLVRLHQGFSAGFDDVVRSGQPRAALEMLLVRLSRRPPLIPIDDLISRLATLEQRLGAPRQASPPSPSSHGGGGDAQRSTPRTAEPIPPARPRPREPQVQPAKKDDVASEKAPEPPRNGAPRPEMPSENAVTVWRRIVDRVRLTRPDLAALLNHAVVLEVRPGRVALAFEAGSIFERTAKAEVAVIRAAATGEFGSEPDLVFSAVSSTASAPTVSAIENKEREERLRAARVKAQEHPRIAEAAEILGAKLKDIQLPDE